MNHKYIVSESAEIVDVGEARSVLLFKTEALTLKGWAHKGLKQPFAVSEAYSGMIIGEGQTEVEALMNARKVAQKDLFIKRMYDRRKKMDAHVILAVIRVKAGLDTEETLRLIPVLDYRTGKFRKKKPADVAGALWSVLQPNIYKVNVGSVLLYASDPLVKKLLDADIRLPAKFDFDAEFLRRMGVWP